MIPGSRGVASDRRSRISARKWSTCAGSSGFFCFSTCVDSIRTIPVLLHDPDRLGDLDTTQEDHAADDWRYACNSRPWMKPTLKKSGPIIKPRWPTFKELMDEHDRRMKMKGRRI